MSDEIRLDSAPRPVMRMDIMNHRCEREGCVKEGGFGFAKPRQDSHWFCFEHREDGERFL